jgi:BCD family chlorophyll transporter-like MFS transporter
MKRNAVVDGANAGLGWFGIFRLGLVQASLGSIVVLTTSTINRVMVVELALPAMLPGLLVALHYFIQVARPRLGYGSDVAGRRTPWIVGGMALLGLGAIGAAVGTALMEHSVWTGIALATVSFTAIGLGVGASGTTMLVLMSKRVHESRLPAAATMTWVMMIVGFILTTIVCGALLEPFSMARLVEVTAGVAAFALVVTFFAVRGIEREGLQSAEAARIESAVPRFRQALAEVWSEPQSRRLSGFIFLSMLAYSAQDLILEPFAGAVFGMTPAQSTKLSGTQNAGVLVGMLLVAVAASGRWRGRFGTLRTWTIGGCVASAMALVGLAVGGLIGPAWPLKPSVLLLGIANGAFAVAAIGSMMKAVNEGRESREGTRMGLWGAAQAIAFGLGGILGTAAVDIATLLFGSAVWAYAAVFGTEALLFSVATAFAIRLSQRDFERGARGRSISGGEMLASDARGALR